MRDFRRFPPLLQVASILGLLFSLASIVLFLGLLITVLPSFPRSPADVTRVVAIVLRVFAIAMNLGLLGGACSFAVNTYRTRFRRSDSGPFPLDSWQSQVRAIVLLAALPICALVLVVVVPPGSLAFLVVFLISLIEAFALLAAFLYATIRWRARG